MRPCQWIWLCIRALCYLAVVPLLILGEKSSSPEIRGCLAGFLIADLLVDILVSLLTLPTLNGWEAGETLIKILLALAVVHYWGIDVPSESDAIGPGFIVFLLTGAIKTTGFAMRLLSGFLQPDE